MTIDIPFDVNKRVCFTSPTTIFNSGVIEAIEAEIFIKVRDDATGDIVVLKPDAVKTKAETEAYINSVLAMLAALPDEGSLPEPAPEGA